MIVDSQRELLQEALQDGGHRRGRIVRAAGHGASRSVFECLRRTGQLVSLENCRGSVHSVGEKTYLLEHSARRRVRAREPLSKRSQRQQVIPQTPLKQQPELFEFLVRRSQRSCWHIIS
jgi:hypothetical protein